MVDHIQNDLKAAQLARDEVKVSTLRLLMSEINNARIALRPLDSSSTSLTAGAQGSGQDSITEDQIIAVIQKEVKKRKEAAAAFRQGDREEQAQKEEAELKILEGYLPAQVSDGELTGMVDQAITEVGATNIADMGKVMGVVMGKVGSRADGGRVSVLVKEKLQ